MRGCVSRRERGLLFFVLFTERRPCIGVGASGRCLVLVAGSSLVRSVAVRRGYACGTITALEELCFLFVCLFLLLCERIHYDVPF